jgi:hypothetical protein
MELSNKSSETGLHVAFAWKYLFRRWNAIIAEDFSAKNVLRDGAKIVLTNVLEC